MAEEKHAVADASSEDKNNEDDGAASEEPAEYSLTEVEEQDTEDEYDIESAEEITPEETILSAEERLNEEIEELLSLLGLSQSMITVTNEMISPPEEDEWQPPKGYRAIINPGGVGQPRDGDFASGVHDLRYGTRLYILPCALYNRENPREDCQSKFASIPGNTFGIWSVV